MKKTRRSRLALTLLVLPALAHAQGPFYWVYGWETPRQGWVELSHWTSYVAKSDEKYTRFGENVSRQGLWAHAAELEYGVTDRFSVGAYADFERPSGGPIRFTEARLLGRYRFFQRYSRFFDPAIYVEYYLPRTAYSSSDEIEARLILEKDMGDLRLLLNPLFSKAVSGHNVDQSLQLGFAGGLYYRRYHAVQPGLEIYTHFVRGVSGDRKPQNILFPSVDLRFGGRWLWNLGVGFGLNRQSDKLTFKSILSYEFGTVRPSQQAK